MNHTPYLLPTLLTAAALAAAACVNPEPPGQLPIVDYEAPVNCYVDQIVVFDASASYDPDGAIAWYTFDFGDGDPSVRTKDPVVEHAWTRPGTYWTQITVIDRRGNKSTDLREIVVNNPDDQRGLRCQMDRPFCPPFFTCDPDGFRCLPTDIYCEQDPDCPKNTSCREGLCHEIDDTAPPPDP